MVASDGERRFLHTMGANAVFCAEDVNMEIVKQAKILHVAGTYLMPTFDGEQTAEILRQAREDGVRTCLDTAFNDRLDEQAWRDGIFPCLPYLDFFVPSMEEAEEITGKSDPAKMAAVCHDKGCEIVCIKMGGEGCYVSDSGHGIQIPKFDVEAKDTSGAGDCWCAGFLKGVLEGWPLEECGRFGNAVAAFGVQAIGCSTGVTSFDEIKEFMSS
ncbi:MAG: hypothetical protein ISS36_03860 [Candidatus Aenigmarchaeota archaeon]|nr:hypothetical protein [Candidatus Aenigmarchaeota archaeon]